MSSPAIHIDPARVISPVDRRIYSGFTEHMGRCIYGGIYDPKNPHGLSHEKTGLRKDVLALLKELRPPLLRYPGGNFVSTYRWQDGVGPRHLRPRRPELAWLTEESNEFGTDEFIDFCREVGSEPYLCLNMGTGTLEDALAWLEYCNSSADTYYANLRRKNGHEEPFAVKYWSLGNEVWGPWQVGQMEAVDYAKVAFQWAKALRLLDPSIKIISCGETGATDWDRITLKKLAPLVDFHSIHFYTKSQGNHTVNVMGPAGPEKEIEIARSLIDLAKIENNLSKELTICYDEWNVWDPERAPGEKGAEETYDLSDALAVAAWLNVFVRKADIVKIACIAQSVNVISPIFTSPQGLFRQTTYFPLHLFSTLMEGESLSLQLVNSPPELAYKGPTFPPFVQKLENHTHDSAKLALFVDVSAVVVTAGDGKRQVRLAIINKHEEAEYDIPVNFGPCAKVEKKIVIHSVWHENLKVSNTFGAEVVQTVVTEEDFNGSIHLKRHSFQVIVFTLVDA